MPHTFDHVPIKHVEATAVLGVPLAITPDLLYAVQSVLRNDFSEPIMPAQSSSLTQQSASMIVGAQPTLVLRDPVKGADVLLYSDAIVSRWMATSEQTEYVRHGSLRKYLLMVVEAIGARPVVMRLAYRTFFSPDQTHPNPWEWMNRDWQPKVVDGAVPTSEITVGYQLPDFVDFRVSSIHSGEGMTVATDAGTVVGDRGPQAALDIVHERIVGEFARIVSDEYKTKWGYRPSL